MKLKREIIIISLIIAVLFTISSVCAVDSEIQAISTHNSTDESVSAANDINLKMNDANEILAETDDGSFAALNTKITTAEVGSTVYLENDYTRSETVSSEKLLLQTRRVSVPAERSPSAQSRASGWHRGSGRD